MAKHCNVKQGVHTVYPAVSNQKEQIAHPCNCKHECPYGFGRSFCFPCMAKIMSEHRAAQRKGAE